jgi:Mrp family chromosome partitioning ATPase
MNDTSDAPSIFAPLWRRKWLILLVGVLVAAGTYFYYKRQAHVYESTTQLFLGGAAEEQAQLTGGGGVSKKNGAINAPNQAAVINSSLVKAAVHERLRHGKKNATTRAALKGKAVAAAKEKSAFITITTKAKRAPAAALLANVTAQTFIKRQNANHQRALTTAISLARRQLRRIELSQVPPPSSKEAASGKSGSKSSGAKGSEKSTPKNSAGTGAIIQAANLSAKINQLESNLYVAGVKQIDPAKPGTATLLSPKPRQNAIFGFAIGILLAAVAAYVLNRLDRRLRSLTHIESVFKTTILTALPVVRRPIVKTDGQPVPSRFLREPIRRLQMSLGVASSTAAENGRNSTQPRSILFVSADPGDGKSTVVADLALVERDAGKRVALVEADFRRPVQGKLLDVRRVYGLAEVLDGRLAAEDAMEPVATMQTPTDREAGSAPAGLATLVESSQTGSISVLLGGGEVANPPALLARPRMSELLRSLVVNYDYVLVDAPVPLQVSDAMPLLNAVDGIVLVARVGHTSEDSARRLVQLLAGTPSAPVLGVVANAVPASEIEKYGFSPAGGKLRWRRKLIGR